LKLINNNFNGKVNFVCADPDENGAGHFFRCVNLSYYLTALGFDCYFFIKSNDKAKLIKSFQSKININFDINNLPHSEWLVVDDYEWTMLKVKSISHTYKKLIYFDDLGLANKLPDIILNYSPNAKKNDYIENNNQELILSSEATIFDEIFLEIRKLSVNKLVSFPPKTILLNLGFSPPKEFLFIWIISLFSFFENIKIEVNLGPNIIKDKSFIDKLNEYNNKIKIHSFIKNTIDFYMKFDMVFGNCGINSLERAVANIPSVNIMMADNQKHNYNFLKENNALVFHDDNNVSLESVTSFLKTITSQKLKASIVALSNLYDGFGPRRCALAMAGKVSLNKGNLWFRQISKNDVTLLYKWRLEKNTVIASRNPPPKNYNLHVEWFNSKLIDKPLIFSIIMFDDNPVGVLRLEEIGFNENSFEIFINISESYQNQNIAKTSLSLLTKITPNMSIYANVLDNNQNSVKLFCNSNFVKYKNNWYKRS
jgi:spore coat polysaccharide biosynthesis predicted glycosyltransferase SpsG/RimJ/RimL family protein N-acetyltransferase